MRVLYYGDVHWSQYSSILRSRDTYYSTRLDNLIRSVNWAEEQAAYQNCSAIIIGGDFFDSSHLNAEEISALREIRWAPISHVIITGNHEANTANLEYSTAELFNLCPNSVVLSYPQKYNIDGTDCEFCFLPYILERDRKDIQDYFPLQEAKKRIIFSHNDIRGINYGNFESPEGFDIDDIESSCNLFINGHIHHYMRYGDAIINGGNLTGQNFTEDETYKHGVLVIDTDTLKVEIIENPFAINFIKFDASKINDENKFMDKINELSSKPCVMTIKVNEDFSNTAKDSLNKYIRPNIIEKRFIVDRNKNLSHNNIEIEAIDHMKQFENYVLSNIGDTQAIRDELAALLN